MSNPRVFLACYDRGVTRATESHDGAWKVDRALPEFQVTCLAQDPSNPRVVYAGTREHGVWRSEDRGRTWNEVGLRGQVVKSLAVSPHDSDTLFAGSKPALLFRSLDRGASWQEMEGFRRIPNRWWWFSPADPPDWRPYIISISPSPADPQVILAGIEFGAVVRSEDGGETWSRHLRGTLRDCHSLAFHPRHAEWAYQAGGSGGGASYSRDGGRTWHKAGRGLAKHYGIVCGADLEEPQHWYVCVGSGPGNAFGGEPAVYLYRREPDDRWQPIGWTTHPLRQTPTVLTTLPGHPGEIYAGLKTGEVWHSPDYGDSWSQLPFNLGGIWFSLLALVD